MLSPEEPSDSEIQPPQPVAPNTDALGFSSATEAYIRAETGEMPAPGSLGQPNHFTVQSVLGYILFVGLCLTATVSLALIVRTLVGTSHFARIPSIIFLLSLCFGAFLVLRATSATRHHWLRWTFLGDGGLRAGWSIAIFALLTAIFAGLTGFVVVETNLLNPNEHLFTAGSAFLGELTGFVGVVGAASIVALIERRRSLLAFNLTGPQRIPHFFSGLAAGFLALSVLVGALAWGGWMHFGPIALSGVAIFKFGAFWAAAFLLVGCVEEGIFRCYLQFTLTRSINFWWALAIVAALCLALLLRSKGNGVFGVYIIALLGLLACLILHIRKTPRSTFWQAAWVTSTLFGYIHTGNGGENWIGIFAAGLIGFVFCVSVYVTGSAWWAIGCHAAWDWAETFFYGTADSGNLATGHYLASSPAGNEFWSGGADGPEGSVLVLGVILLLLAALVIFHDRKMPGTAALERAIG